MPQIKVPEGFDYRSTVGDRPRFSIPAEGDTPDRVGLTIVGPSGSWTVEELEAHSSERWGDRISGLIPEPWSQPGGHLVVFTRPSGENVSLAVYVATPEED